MDELVTEVDEFKGEHVYIIIGYADADDPQEVTSKRPWLGAMASVSEWRISPGEGPMERLPRNWTGMLPCQVMQIDA
jgi:hypothetical protein